MSPMHTAIADCLPIVRGEFREMPGLRLTKPQVQRLCSVDARTCEALLRVLVRRHVLRRTQNGAYARVDAPSA